MGDENRRSVPLFPISIVKSLTQLSARQIRYYEEHNLVHPARTEGNRRLYSFNDVDRLLEVKDFIEKGINLAGIKQVLLMKEQTQQPENEQELEKARDLTDKELRHFLRNELLEAGRLGKSSLRQGELSRFFH